MATTQTDSNVNRYTVKKAILSYTSKRSPVTGRTVHTLFEPCESKINNEVGPPKFGCSLIINEESQADQIKAIEEIIERMLTAQWGAKAKRSPKLHNPLRNGTDFPDKKGYGEGVRFLNVSADVDHKPEVIGPRKDADGKFPRLRKEDGFIYSGCIANVSLNFFVFGTKLGAVNKGVGVGLGNVQFVGHGERLGGGVAADAEFEEEGEEETENLLD